MLAALPRRELMVMDMDVVTESETPSRNATPPSSMVEEDKLGGEVPNANGTTDLGDKDAERGHQLGDNEPEQSRKIGNLMKELKQDVQQGAMEFNMDNFF
jgi:hypothetical protein